MSKVENELFALQDRTNGHVAQLHAITADFMHHFRSAIHEVFGKDVDPLEVCKLSDMLSSRLMDAQIAVRCAQDCLSGWYDA